jgi:hypothetical protein
MGKGDGMIDILIVIGLYLFTFINGILIGYQFGKLAGYKKGSKDILESVRRKFHV